VRTIFGQGGGSSDVDSALFWNKFFSKFMVCPHGKKGEGLSQCRHFADKGEKGLIFVILCERLIWTAPYEGLQLLFVLVTAVVLPHLFSTFSYPEVREVAFMLPSSLS